MEREGNQGKLEVQAEKTGQDALYGRIIYFQEKERGWMEGGRDKRREGGKEGKFCF